MFRPDTDWLKKWAYYTPKRMFLRDHDRDLSWTYRDFNNRANILAERMQKALNLRRGDRVGVYSRNSAEFVLIYFACWKLGVIIVPYNFRLMHRELDILIGDSKPLVMYYEREFSSQFDNLNTMGNIKHKIEIESLTSLLTEDQPDTMFTQPEPVDFDDIQMILYTAGTTGLPKGAIITHKMLFWNAVNTTMRLDITSADHTQSFAPFFHTGGWNVLFTPFLFNGASHTLLSKFDPELILRLMDEEKTTLLFGVPTMLQMMSDTPLFSQVDLSSLRYAIVGGAPMPVPLIELWHKKGVYIRQGYGLTEVGPNCFSLHHDDAVRKAGSIGFPNFYIDAKIADESGDEVSPGENGELWLRSPVVTPGYWGKEAETAAAITDGWFHTGDMMMRDNEGYHFVVDRKKNMYISGGENVYPAEVEKFLYTNQAVHEVAVLGVPDEKWGEVGMAVIALKPGFAVTAGEMKEYCRNQLAKYKIPVYFEFVESLPKNDAGKINRMELAKLYSPK